MYEEFYDDVYDVGALFKSQAEPVWSVILLSSSTRQYKAGLLNINQKLNLYHYRIP